MTYTPHPPHRSALDSQNICRSWIRQLDILLKDCESLYIQSTKTVVHIAAPELKLQAENMLWDLLNMVERIMLMRKRISKQLNFYDILPQPLLTPPYQWEELELLLNDIVIEFSALSNVVTRLINH